MFINESTLSIPTLMEVDSGADVGFLSAVGLLLGLSGAFLASLIDGV